MAQKDTDLARFQKSHSKRFYQGKFLLLASLLFLTFFLIIPLPLFGAGDAIDLLKESFGPRAIALGSAFSAVGGTIFGPGWNPASLGQVSRPAVASSYASILSEISQVGVIGAYPIFEGCLSVTFLLEKTGDTAQTIEGADGRPEVTDYFADTKWLFGLSYGRHALLKNLILGANLKYQGENLAGANAMGMSFDLGGLYHLYYSDQDPGPLSIGLTLRNLLTTKYNWSTGNVDSLSREVVIGVAYQGRLQSQKFLITADLSYGLVKKICAGLEYWFTEIVPLRIGVNKMGSLTFGSGLKISDLNFDVSYFNHSDLGPTYNFAFTWNF